MSALGEVLERMHTAWDHLSSAQGTMRFWYEPIRTHHAWERWRDQSPPGSIAMIPGPVARGGMSPQGAATNNAREPYSEQYYRFWMAKPWRWRIEQFSAVGPQSLAEPQQILVIDGGIWWNWSEGAPVYTNARSTAPKQARHPGVDRGLLVMLDPASLTGTLRMRVGGSADEIGRRGDVVSGTARDPQPDPGLWPGADEYRLLVERAHGVLLRAEALLAGEVYSGTAFTELTLDQAAPDERFVFQAPAGVPVHNM